MNISIKGKARDGIGIHRRLTSRRCLRYRGNKIPGDLPCDRDRLLFNLSEKQRFRTGARARNTPFGAWREALICSNGNHAKGNTMKAVLTAIIEKAPEGGFWAICPEFPGANGQGETLEETRKNLALPVLAYPVNSIRRCALLPQGATYISPGLRRSYPGYRMRGNPTPTGLRHSQTYCSSHSKPCFRRRVLYSSWKLRSL
uniref:Uncharacterized protein n=1 Tax=Candidatus Kentrum sp. TUN TaxID=2126343 RepID=A0A450ZTB3_9GAMM|nr:MAG: Uncharacterised protein family (UPF0150) [Candidatus Kentron sp. TUN]VFK64905.1 MAG: Uncharacterised protein family (UPF0150) [Candidatus Kentron sp. TUN]